MNPAPMLYDGFIAARDWLQAAGVPMPVIYLLLGTLGIGTVWLWQLVHKAEMSEVQRQHREQQANEELQAAERSQGSNTEYEI